VLFELEGDHRFTSSIHTLCRNQVRVASHCMAPTKYLNCSSLLCATPLIRFMTPLLFGAALMSFVITALPHKAKQEQQAALVSHSRNCIIDIDSKQDVMMYCASRNCIIDIDSKQDVMMYCASIPSCCLRGILFELETAVCSNECHQALQLYMHLRAPPLAVHTMLLASCELQQF
jgi:hypothetical protein